MVFGYHRCSCKRAGAPKLEQHRQLGARVISQRDKESIQPSCYLSCRLWTSSALNTIVILEKERLRPADKAAVHMKPFTCFMNIRSTRSSAESWATACCWCCQSVRALASGRWRLQRPAYAGPPNVAKRVHLVKVGYRLYTVYTSHVNVSMLFAPHVWLKTRSESNWCPHKNSILFTGQPCHSVLASFAFSIPLSSLWHSPRSTASS